MPNYVSIIAYQKTADYVCRIQSALGQLQLINMTTWTPWSVPKQMPKVTLAGMTPAWPLEDYEVTTIHISSTREWNGLTVVTLWDQLLELIRYTKMS